METVLTNFGVDTEAYAAFAKVLRYPQASWQDEIQVLEAQLAQSHPDAVAALKEFMLGTQDVRLEELQEMYTRAFDVAPQCIPYLSVYLFGEESHKRSELMTGLMEAYESAGYEHDNELSDHLSIVLGYAPYCTESEWAELAHWVLPGPLGEMLRSLTRSQNPYAHVLRALACVFKAQYPQEFCHV
jgi:nitrate reductase molybdenum cofactor assembly chaperone